MLSDLDLVNRELEIEWGLYIPSCKEDPIRQRQPCGPTNRLNQYRNVCWTGSAPIHSSNDPLTNKSVCWPTNLVWPTQQDALHSIKNTK